MGAPDVGARVSADDGASADHHHDHTADHHGKLGADAIPGPHHDADDPDDDIAEPLPADAAHTGDDADDGKPGARSDAHPCRGGSVTRGSLRRGRLDRLLRLHRYTGVP
ncbi:hypothetical protein BH11ACT7_BH11ACT7_17620 [soil metagenome]